MRSSPENSPSTGGDATASPNRLKHIPPAVYIRGGRTIGYKYTGSEKGRRWVQQWRALHCKSAPFDRKAKERIRQSIQSVYGLAGYAPPSDLFFELGDELFIERILLEMTLRSQACGSWNDFAWFNHIQDKERRLLRDLFHRPMTKLELSMACAMHRTKIPSSRELFGENGADTSALGLRIEPVVWAIAKSKGLIMKELSGKLARVLSPPDAQDVNAEKKRFTYLHKAPLPCLHVIKEWADKQELLTTFGNQCTGLFRQFAFLKREWGNQVDFTHFNPWLRLIENVQHVYFGESFAVVCPLPTKISASRHGFQREWDVPRLSPRIITSDCSWDLVFGRHDTINSIA